jgi:hypothetical protein
MTRKKKKLKLMENVNSKNCIISYNLTSFLWDFNTGNTNEKAYKLGTQKSGNEKMKFHCTFHFWSEKEVLVTEMQQTSDVTKTLNMHLRSSILRYHTPMIEEA